MPFGIKSAPEVFQQRMTEAVEGLSGIAVVADDILVYGEGETRAEALINHDENLKNLLERCRKNNLKINKDKLKLRLSEMSYVGHLLTEEGVKPDPKKVEAVRSMKAPNNLPELKRFLGMISYLSKFLPSISTRTESLRQLDKKGSEWHWNKNHLRDFNKIKEMITEAPVLKYFNPTKKITLQCDASQGGLGAALL